MCSATMNTSATVTTTVCFGQSTEAISAMADGVVKQDKDAKIKCLRGCTYQSRQRRKTMAEYIERDLVISKIEERAMLRCRAHDAVTYKHLKLVKWDIADLPAADVFPVRRGRWNVYSAKDCLYTCSECHCLPRDRTPYCPNCGAKMEETE